MSKEVIYKNLGKIKYKKAWDLQEEIFNNLMNAKLNNADHKKQYLLFCVHDPVYTLGKSGDKQNLLITEQICKDKNIDYYPINRGGDITYHGPGQLVVYPILDMEEFDMGVKKYIYRLEEVIINTLKEFDIQSSRDTKAIGVWIDPENPSKARKICAIGVKASRYISMHGLAFNVNTDLEYFNDINPCGFVDKGVTSMQKELGYELDFNDVSECVKKHFKLVFGMDIIKS